MKFNVLNQADYTSSPIGPFNGRVDNDNYPATLRLFIWGDLGSGSVELQILMPDDTYQVFPDLTFTSKTAQDIVLFNGAVVKVNITGATSASVMITD